MKTNILIAEDEKVQLETMGYMLEANEFCVTKTTNGQDAMKAIEKKDFELLVTDFRMPFMNGIDLAKNAIKINPNLTIIMLTGSIDPETIMEALNIGIAGFIKKPFDIKRLLEKIKECIAKKRVPKILKQTIKMAGLGELSASIFHEFKNSLNGINMINQTLENKDLSNDEHAEYQKLMRKEIDRMDRVIKHLLNFSRKEEKIINVNLKQFFESILTLYSDGIHMKSIETNIRSNICIETIPDSLSIIFLNLIGNAIQSMNQGGILNISVWQNGNINIEISDTGCGIPPEIQERIFENFFTTKGDQGNGLGLATVKKELKLLGGQIALRSQVNQGTTFTVSLPN